MMDKPKIIDGVAYHYCMPIKVRYADTDAQGHVFFGNYLTYLDEALGGYLNSIGFPWQKLAEIGLDIFYVAAHCEFKGSATFDDVLNVYSRMARIGNTSFTLEGVILKQGADNPITSGYITAVVVDPKTRQPVRVPDELRQATAEFEQ